MSEKVMRQVFIYNCKACGCQPEFQHRIIDTEWGGPMVFLSRCENKACENHKSINVITASSGVSLVCKWNEIYGDENSVPRELMIEVEA